MGWHTVVLDDSFEHIGSLPIQVRDEIASVLKGLEEDPYFLPGDDYITQRDEDGFVVCEHVRGWGGWVLGWSFEYSPSTSATVQNVVAFLYQRHSDEPSREALVPKLNQ